MRQVGSLLRDPEGAAERPTTSYTNARKKPTPEMETGKILGRLAEKAEALEAKTLKAEALEAETPEGEAWGPYRAWEEEKRVLLTSLFEHLIRAEGTSVTIKKTAGLGEAEGPGHVIYAAGTPVALASFTSPGSLQERASRDKTFQEGTSQEGTCQEGAFREGKSPEEKARPLCRSLKTSRVRFGILFSGRRLRCYSNFFSGSFGELRTPIFDFDLSGCARQEVQKLRALLEAIVTFGLEEDGPKKIQPAGRRSVGHGLLYVLAVPNGEPFGRRQAACKIGITGRGIGDRRRFHEWRLGIEGAEEMRLCYLAAGAAVAAEKLASRRTAHRAPPGLGPQSEWRWCSPARLVETVKEAARGQIREENGRLGLGLAHVTLADPLGPAEPLSSAHPPGPADAPEEAGLLPDGNARPEASGSSCGAACRAARPSLGSDGSSRGSRLFPETMLRRGAEVKRKAIRGTLEKRPEGLVLSFRVSGHEDCLLRECAQQSAYRSRSAYVRDQITGWAQGTSIAAKAGLILHWAAAHWGKSVRSGGWEQLRGLATSFFNPQCISGPGSKATGEPGREDSRSEGLPNAEGLPHASSSPCPDGALQKVLWLARRHLLAVEPLPLQLLGRQLVTMRRFDELKKITAGSGSPRRLGCQEMGTGWAREAKREVLSISEKEDGCRGLKTLRLAPAEREAAEKNFSESGHASISGYVRNRALEWDRDPLVVARAAAAVTWLAGRAGRPIGQEDWKGLGKAMRDAFGMGHLPGADTIRQGLQVAEEHLLGAKKERVAEDTGISVP
ncbi:hypothetical protein GGQ11_002910 [Salinibacter ruber]|uniref:hypothetical protein n=2 Tax=Salinibacter ruber TaxID=146919 RepID=UPI00216753BC|nr:hypothetical protein [Salinibacter ruber]MCS3651854.1 hypothetical protein [Salinibacter ruber]MCS3658109.1 hypothetical protein [Salinibacter ruber]MCS3824015.1 hypothetical protein [Salinibacter ruber]